MIERFEKTLLFVIFLIITTAIGLQIHAVMNAKVTGLKPHEHLPVYYEMTGRVWTDTLCIDTDKRVSVGGNHKPIPSLLRGVFDSAYSVHNFEPIVKKPY